MKKHRSNDHEKGAALMTVLVVSLLLGTACIALLSAVGFSSKNNTDALNEAKAYWAAESGLQATINYLRNTPNMTYSEALNQQAANTLPVSAGNVGSETSYTVQISNPDSGLDYKFYTLASFSPPVPTSSPAPPPVAEARSSPPSICIPNCDVATLNRTEISFAPQATELTVAFPNTTNYNLGTFRVDYFGTGAATIPAGITFKIEYQMTSPRTARRTIRGDVTANASAGLNPVGLTFDSQVYELIGSQLEICGSATPSGSAIGTMCANVTLSLSSVSPTSQVYINATPVEPYRMLVTATGSGPMRAQKKLEGVIIKDLVNGFPYTAALTMLGPGANLDFEQGNGSPIYCGYDQGYVPGQTVPPNAPCTPNPNLPSAPSIGVSDAAGLAEVMSDLSNPLPNPPPDILTDGPDWQHSAAAMHEFVTTLRNRAMQGSTGSLYIPDTNGAATTSLDSYTVGNFTAGTGLTFCEGNCSIGPRQGGGILVVNGNFEYNGNFDFRGTIIVIGSMHRSGAGNGAIVGGVIIAPYNPNDLAAGFGSPSFTTTGGGTADIIFTGDFAGFDGTRAFTNVMIGVAEK